MLLSPGNTVRLTGNKREENIMLKKIIRAVCFLLGLFTLFLAVKATKQISDSVSSLKDATYLESPVVLPENEGKRIVIAGEVKMTKSAYDEELDIVLHTPAAQRAHEVRTDRRSDKKIDREERWSIKDHEYILGEAVLGEFELDRTVLEHLLKTDMYTDFDKEDLKPYSTESTLDRFYLYDGLRTRYYYYHCDLEKKPQWTLVGVQKGNTIVADDLIIAVSEGNLPMSRLRQEAKANGLFSSVLAFAIALGLMLYGLSGVLFKKRREAENGQ